MAYKFTENPYWETIPPEVQNYMISRSYVSAIHPLINIGSNFKFGHDKILSFLITLSFVVKHE